MRISPVIVGENFCWLHMPKTGGTSTAHLFRSLKLAGVDIDDDDIDAKHQSIDARQQSEQIQPSKTTIITTRRLASWLLSDWHHKTKKMGLDLPFEPVKSGLFYSLRLGGTWVAADYWIHYFKATSCDFVVRLENLEEDSNRYVLPLLPKHTPTLQFPRSNTNQYSKKLESFFSKRDLNRIHQNNPAWTSWEQTIYKSLSPYSRTQRLKAQISALMPSAQS